METATLFDAMATTLKYNFVASDEENGVQTVGFVDDQFNTQQYLIFQNWLDAEAEGEDDEIYIERNDQSQGIYGGVERLILARDHALLLLSSETATVINTEEEVKILFSVTDEQFQQLKMGLEIVFTDKQGLELSE